MIVVIARGPPQFDIVGVPWAWLNLTLYKVQQRKI